MANVSSGLVQGIGITSLKNLPDIKIRQDGELPFTEVALPEIVKIPKVKPDIEQLISVTVEPEIVSTRIVHTAEGTSNEGQHLTGRKLIVELKLREKVKYVADEPTQSVHAAHFEKVISSIFVVVPTQIGGTPIETYLEQGRLVVLPFIEDIYSELRDKRTIFKNITVFIYVYNT